MRCECRLLRRFCSSRLRWTPTPISRGSFATLGSSYNSPTQLQPKVSSSRPANFVRGTYNPFISMQTPSAQFFESLKTLCNVQGFLKEPLEIRREIILKNSQPHHSKPPKNKESRIIPCSVQQSQRNHRNFKYSF